MFHHLYEYYKCYNLLIMLKNSTDKTISKTFLTKIIPGILVSLLLIFVSILYDEFSFFNTAYAIHEPNFILPPEDQLPIISTRGHFDQSGNLEPGVTPTSYAAFNVPGLNNMGCPQEISIYVHGWDTTRRKAIEAQNTVITSLVHNGYSFPTVAFSWEAGSAFLVPDPFNFQTWPSGNLIANLNGPKLGQAILDFKDNCPHDIIHIMGHSMGARVVLSILNYLHNNQQWNANNYKIESVHLFGAAVDNELPSMNRVDCEGGDVPQQTPQDHFLYQERLFVQRLLPCQGESILNELNILYNYHNPSDSVLDGAYKFTVGDIALGQHGAQQGIQLPTNYNQRIITQELPKPDEHVQYMGYLCQGLLFEGCDKGELVHDGVMNLVVEDWRVSLVPPDTTITSAIDGNNNPINDGDSTLSPEITFNFEGTDNSNAPEELRFECRLDDSGFQTCSTPKKYINLDDGKEHIFQVRAIDTSGNVDPTPSSFNWRILTPAEGIQKLIDTINNMNLDKGTQTSLNGPLQNAIKLLTDNNPSNDNSVCNKLNAFLEQVDAKGANGRLTSQQAAEIRQEAKAIQNSLGCEIDIKFLFSGIL